MNGRKGRKGGKTPIKRKRRPKSPNRLGCSIPEAGALLDLSREAAYKAAGRGDIFYVQIGRRKIVPIEWIHKKLAGAGA
jgi:hypothetical protein